MIRLGVVVASAALFVQTAAASDVLPPGESAPTNADLRCAALGEGFFAVAGSSACVQISGHISAGANFGSGAPAAHTAPHFTTPAANKFDGETAVSGDLRFDTPAGPGRVYIDVRKDTYSHWVDKNQ
jgi:hypothetical protein